MASRKEELKVDLVANDRLSKTVDDAADKVDKLDGRDAKVSIGAEDNATATVEGADAAVESFDDADASATLEADDQATSAAEDATTAVEALDDVTGTATADLDDQATDAVGDATESVEALDDVSGTAVAELTDNATDEASTVQEAVEALDDVSGTATADVEVDDASMTAVDDLATAVDSVDGEHTAVISLDGADQASEVTGEIAGNLAEAFGPKGLAAAAAGLLVNIGAKAADQVVEIDNMAGAVGGTTEEVSALFDQWEYVGGSADSLEQTILRVNGKLRNETNGLAKQLGINITDAKTPLDLFIEAVGVLNSDQLTANERLDVAMDLFGRKGTLLLNDLKTDVGDLQTAMENAGEEVLIHDSDVEAARGIKQAWDAIGDKIGELERNLLPALLPILEQAAGLLSDALGGDAGDVAGVGGGLPPSLEDIMNEEGNVEDFWAGVVQAATTASDETVGAVEDIADAAEAIPEVMSPVADAFDEAATAADNFRSSLDKIIDPSMNLVEAEDQLHQNIQDLTVAVLENGLALTNTTEAGRKNRAQIRDNVNGALDYAEALIENGHSADEAAAFLDNYRAELRAQLIQLGFNETSVDNYLDALGLTPANVSTAIEMTGEADANAVIERHNQNLDKIPPYVSSQIQAAIRQGDIERANQLLDSIIDPHVRVHVHLPGLPRIGYQGSTPYYDYTGGTGPVALARGAYTGGLSPLAQLHPHEVVLPLRNPGRMQELLGMAEVGPRVAAAMSPMGGAVVGGDTFHVTINMPPGSNGQDVLNALQREQRRLGVLPLRVAATG